MTNVIEKKIDFNSCDSLCLFVFNRSDEDFTMDALARSRRKALKVAVGALCLEVGFGIAEESALETLTEMLQSCRFYSYRHRGL